MHQRSILVVVLAVGTAACELIAGVHDDSLDLVSDARETGAREVSVAPHDAAHDGTAHADARARDATGKDARDARDATVDAVDARDAGDARDVAADAPHDTGASDVLHDSTHDAPRDVCVPHDAPRGGPACYPLSDGGLDAAQPLLAIPDAYAYGPYCNTVDPKTGAWSLHTYHDIGQVLDAGPCVSGVGRRGLHASWVEGTDASPSVHNNALAECSVELLVYTGPAVQPIDKAFNGVKSCGACSCAITATPVSLPIFSVPYALDGGAAPTLLGAFDFDLVHVALPAGEFGSNAEPADAAACGFDRTGTPRCRYGTAVECGDAGAGCMIEDPSLPLGVGYTWGMPEGTQALSVANGLVRASFDRTVAGCCESATEGEVYVEYDVGDSRAPTYTEKFIVGYLGLSSRAVNVGDTPNVGQLLGRSGRSGCGTPALRFVVLHLTNIVSTGSYPFAAEDAGPYGFNGIQGAIDPFGWGGPSDTVDPWGYLFNAGVDAGGLACGLTPGAFSINLWKPDAAPPHPE